MKVRTDSENYKTKTVTEFGSSGGVRTFFQSEMKLDELTLWMKVRTWFGKPQGENCDWTQFQWGVRTFFQSETKGVFDQNWQSLSLILAFLIPFLRYEKK